MSNYANEEFYNNQYLAGRNPVIKTGFDFYARDASQLINLYTFERLKDLVEIPEIVKMCCCELAEQSFTREKQKKDAAGKTSERIGTYAVTFATGQEGKQSAVRAQVQIIQKWLGNTGLLYRGV